MEQAQDRLIRYLQDAHAAEVGIVGVLEGYVNDTENQQVKQLFTEHVTQTQSQASRLEARLQALGSGASGGKGFLNTILGKLQEIMHGAHDEYDKATQNLIKAYAVEHLERGMYESLIAYATALGDTETAALGRQIQAEEEQTAQKLWPFISQLAENTYNAAKVNAA